MSKFIGDVSAYAYAVSKGYTGTEEEYAELMASYATVGQTAVTAAQTATTKASEAATSATTATNKASEATTAATTATTKAGEASTSASTATSAKDTAVSASQTATTKATEATTAAETATTAKNDAETAKNAAETAQGKAETAQGAAEDAAESVSASASQIQTNKEDISELKSDLNADVAEITSKLIKVESNNYAKSDSDVTAGYVAQNGVVYSASSLWYTNKIPVAEGDVVRLYTYSSGAFTAKSMRFVCAYNSAGQAVPASGTENVYAYTVPSGITHLVLTSSGTASNVHQLMVTRNYEATGYEPYFAPYYIASEEFVENVLDNYNVPEFSVKGYNLIPESDNGEGYYYGASVGSKIKFGQSTSYHYAIMPVKKNTDYYCSANPRFWAFTDDADVVTSYGEDSFPSNSGDGTKLYYSISKGIWDNESQYGSLYALIVSEGVSGTYYNVKKPSFVSGITQNMMDAKYGCALPKKTVRFTVNQEQTWYYKNILALANNEVHIQMNGHYSYVDGGIKINHPSAQADSGNGYYYHVYDERLSCIAQQSQKGVVVCADNLQNCSALVIGDSTVAQNYLTSKMLGIFSDKGKTLTLLGTIGAAPNKHEGRSGWSARQYCTVDSSGGVLNPFYNPESNKFDFAYYMANQGYSSVDFVVIQLGINDLYNVEFVNADDKIKTTADYIKEMVDSIHAFNSSQKVLLNLPTAVNDDQTKQYHLLSTIRNKFVRYNEYIQYRLLNYSTNILRFSHCHLILDPRTDISDDVHPTEVGYEKMANEVVSQINCWQNNA